VRLAIGAALIIAVTIEIAANPIGLGRAMMKAQESLHPELMFAYLFWVGLVGWSINVGILKLQTTLFGAVQMSRP
jgi:NitT/TauT family transport system permease protein